MLLEREWVTIRDPDDRHLRYTFDVSFLLSAYTCIYAAGCRGIRSGGDDLAVGCCVHGAYMTEDHEGPWLREIVDRDLHANVMEHYDLARRDGFLVDDEDGETHTRLLDGACVFLNGPDFAGGMGCALHHLALRRGEHPMTYKPIVCWQLPLHRTVYEDVGNDGEPVFTHAIAAFERGTWGEGGADFHWWCTEDPAAFVGHTPVYRAMAAELAAMVGADVYAELAGYLDRRGPQRHRVVFLPVAP